MLHFHHKKTLQEHLSEMRKDSKTIGFVPTMGALHRGHLSLVEAAFRENDAVVVSIFVNPTQFNNPQDLDTYPRTLGEDIEKLQHVSSEVIVFSPAVNTMYNGTVTAVEFDFDGLELEMEGKYRDGHFNGVATIVKKLFEAVQPHKAYFGEKDYQQLLIVKKLVAKYDLPVQIIGCPIARELNGLAMSSRNERLSAALRKEAAFIYHTLVWTKEVFETESITAIKERVIQKFNDHPDFDLEYFEIADAQTLKPVAQKAGNKKYRVFIAVYANTIRLIDNIALN